MTTFAAIALLVAVYLLTLGSLDPWDVAGGTVVGAAAVALLGGPRERVTGLARRMAGLPAFAWAVAREVAAGTWLVTRMVLGTRELRRPGIVAVPIGERSPTGLVVTALAINLSPGEVLVDVDHDRGVMLVHVLDAEDPDAVRERYEQFYRRYQRPLAP